MNDINIGGVASLAYSNIIGEYFDEALTEISDNILID